MISDLQIDAFKLLSKSMFLYMYELCHQYSTTHDKKFYFTKPKFNRNYQHDQALGQIIRQINYTKQESKDISLIYKGTKYIIICTCISFLYMFYL